MMKYTYNNFEGDLRICEMCAKPREHEEGRTRLSRFFLARTRREEQKHAASGSLGALSFQDLEQATDGYLYITTHKI
jgi:hypothetical protein